MSLDIAEIIYALAGLALGWLARQSRSWLKWRKVRRMAKAELAAPVGTDDPRTAIENALSSVQRARIKAETMKLPRLNGEIR